MTLTSPSTRLLSAQRIATPHLWRETVRDALTSTGSVTLAARALGVSRRTLAYWIEDEPELAEGLELRGPGRVVSSGNSRAK